MTTVEKGVFIQIQNTIVSSKALVLVNCLNTSVDDCSLWAKRWIAAQIRHKPPYPRDTGPLSNDGCLATREGTTEKIFIVLGRS